MENINTEEEEILEIENDDLEITNTTPFTTVKKFNLDEIESDSLIYLASAKNTDIEKLKESTSTEKSKELANSMNEDDITAIYTATEGAVQTYEDDALNDLDKKTDHWDQIVSEDNKSLAIRNVPIGNKARGTLSGKKAKLKFASYLGVGGITQIPLWHSGFWISLNSITETKVIDLDIRIGKNHIDLGRDTNGAIFSNESVVYDELVMEFIIDNIMDSSLDLNDDDDIRDYIKIQDFNTMVLGLIEAVSPKGFGVILTCKNATKFDSNNGLECNYTATGTVDPKKLLYVDRDHLTKNQLQHMAKRGSRVVSKNDLEIYNNEMTLLKDKEIKLESSIGNDVYFIIKTPTIKEHIDHGNIWLENTISMVDELMTDDDSQEAKSMKIEELSKATMMNMYLHFIKEIRTDDGAIVNTPSDISEVLDVIIADSSLYTNFIKEIKKYIGDNILTMIGTPVYICPTCKESQEVTDTGAFKEIIPLNVINSFFDLNALKKTQLLKRESFIS